MAILSDGFEGNMWTTDSGTFVYKLLHYYDQPVVLFVVLRANWIWDIAS